MSEALMFDDVGGNGRTEVIRVRGRLDARTSPLLIERCAAARDAGHDLVLNLHDVTFLSSSGIGSVLALTEEFREHGLSLCLAETSTTVREAIELLNLEEFLTLFDTEAEAMRERAA
jgi:anti-anti-sigma factor